MRKLTLATAVALLLFATTASARIIRVKFPKGRTTVILNSSDIKLFPTKPDCFFEYRFFDNACFVRDDTGKIKEISWKGINFDLTWVKQ